MIENHESKTEMPRSYVMKKQILFLIIHKKMVLYITTTELQRHLAINIIQRDQADNSFFV